MRRCTYCGKEYDDAATVCAIDRQPVVQVRSPPEGGPKQSIPSFEFLRLLFKSPKEEEFAMRCAQFLARVVGEQVALLRPDTKWSEIIEWSGPSVVHAAALALALKKEFGWTQRRSSPTQSTRRSATSWRLFALLKIKRLSASPGPSVSCDVSPGGASRGWRGRWP